MVYMCMYMCVDMNVRGVCVEYVWSVWSVYESVECVCVCV